MNILFANKNLRSVGEKWSSALLFRDVLYHINFYLSSVFILFRYVLPYLPFQPLL